ncbi:MAG: cytochrome c [Vicingaceae bacterium]
MKTRHYKTLFFAAIFGSIFVACSDSQSPGVEYMPDMYRSPAIETYVDYEYPDSATSRHTPENSVPRGYKPFAYPNSTEGYELAGENLNNPLHLTEEKIKEGKALYNTFCAHCHGKEGKGKGSITNAIYGAVPSYSDTLPNRRGNRSMSELQVGHIYHTIMYGLNAMGPHSSLIREQDRWKIVAYVQTLQGKDPLAEENKKKMAEANKAEAENDKMNQEK